MCSPDYSWRTRPDAVAIRHSNSGRHPMDYWGKLIPRAMLPVGGLAIFVIGITPTAMPAKTSMKQKPDHLAERARDILAEKCVACHNSAFKFDPRSRVSLVEDVVVPGKPEASKLFVKVNEGGMPPDPKQRLTPAELGILKGWIEAGAPDWATGGSKKTAPVISETTVLTEIAEDLAQISAERRRFIRYFSIANLRRNAEADQGARVAKEALTKLVNSLSWSPEIVLPEPVGESKVLFRIDVRDLNWTPKTWAEIIDAYPYAFVPAGDRKEVNLIRELSGATVPYVRADWFVANASVPPLYHDILRLPTRVSGLEQMLGIDAERDQRENRVVRAGLTNSGVSRNNRAVERHLSQFGYYYKSFDFASNEGRKNIFQFPVSFTPDGGEFIFRLPNGMQGYMIAKANGERLNVAPVNIVRDTAATFDDVVVTNGLSCISCHANGMKFFSDEVRQNLDTLTASDEDLDRARQWYVPTGEFRRFLLSDAKQFEEAVVKTGGKLPHVEDEPSLEPRDEPVTQIAQFYRRLPVSPAAAAAECGLSLSEFRARLTANPEVTALGLGRLLQDSGSVKRDVWEQSFRRVIERLGVGAFLPPAKPIPTALRQDPRTPVELVVVAKDDLASRLRSQVYLSLDRSDAIKPVTGDAAEKVELRARSNGSNVEISAKVGDRVFRQSGSLEIFSDLAEALADEVHTALTHRVLPAPPSPPPLDASANRGLLSPSTAQILELAAKTGTMRSAVAVDRGPGSTYFMGESVLVRLSVAQECFAAVYDIDAAGQVALLFPNMRAPDNHLLPGRIYDSKDWDLGATDVAGRDRIFLLVAKSKNELPGVEKAGGPGGLVSKSVRALVHQVRASAPPADLGASVVEFFTQEKSARAKGRL